MTPNLLDRAVALLTTHLDEAQRAAWLTQAFHQQYRVLYDAIPQTGAPRDFTVACVRLLLDHGHRDGRHVLSLLLEAVRTDAGEERQPEFQALIAELDRPQAPPDAPDADALARLHQALLVGDGPSGLDRASLEEIRRHAPRNLEAYRLVRIATWSQPRYALDKRYTRLTLLLDQGPQAQGVRFQAQPTPFQDLRDVLAAADAPALVLLGPPGCGTGGARNLGMACVTMLK